MVDGQHQGVGAADIGAAVGECLAGDLPGVAVAGRHHGGVALVDGQVQGNHAVAAVGIGGGVGRLVGRGEVLGTVPDVAVAGLDGIDAGGTMVDGQVEGDHAVAAVLVGEDHGIGRVALGVDIAIPLVAVAGSHGLDGGIAVEDGEVEGHHAVAAFAVFEGVGGDAVALGVDVAVDPSVAVAGLLLVDAGGAVVDGQH